MVNFLSMFSPELQKLLKPIYDLTRRGRPFVWGKEQQDSFEEINCRLTRPPGLICQIQLTGFIYTQTPVSFQLEVHYVKYRMANPN